MNDIINLISRWLHIIPAVIMVGGLIFLRSCIVRQDQESSLFDSMDEVRKRWAKLVMISTLLLLISGLYNTYVKATSYDLSMLYNGLLGAKLLFALVVFFLAALLSGRSERAKRCRTNEAKWLNIALFFAIAVVLMGGAMRLISWPTIP